MQNQSSDANRPVQHVATPNIIEELHLKIRCTVIMGCNGIILMYLENACQKDVAKFSFCCLWPNILALIVTNELKGDVHCCNEVLEMCKSF